MADLFISYSKLDRFEVEKLAASLEAEGWSVWWDKSLSAGDQYRDEIMKELVRARAVVVVWSANSIKSDWVRAEAGQAKASGKLIPVKTDGVGYGDIPLPFGEMHTEPIDNAAQIRAAVAVQLAKPQVQPSGIWMATAELRYALLTWFGIIGGAITLFSSLKGLVTLADWAKVLVENWHEWTHAFWSRVLVLLGVSVPNIWAPFLNFAAFIAATVFGSYFSLRSQAEPGQAAEPSLRLGVKHPLAAAALGILAGMLPLVCAACLAWLADSAFWLSLPRWILAWVDALILVPFVLAPIVLLYFARDRLPAGLSVVLLLVFVGLLSLVPIGLIPVPAGTIIGDGLGPQVLSVGLYIVAVPTALAVLPARQLNRKLVLVLVGLVLLFLLNEVAAKLTPDLASAPKSRSVSFDFKSAER